MKIQDIDLIKLLPSFMQEDGANQGIAEVVSNVLKSIAADIPKLSTFDALEKLSTAELDELADELNCLWYDKTFTDQEKRVLLAKSDQVFARIGTVAAVEDVVESIFGSGFVEEFWEYGGEPHHFKIAINDPSALTEERKAKLLRILEKVKRKSQWLDEIYAATVARIPVKTGMKIMVEREQGIRIPSWTLPLLINGLQKFIWLTQGCGAVQLEQQGENKIVVNTERPTEEELDTVSNLLERVVPKNTIVEYNHGLIQPAGYTRVEYLESDGAAAMELPFESKNKSFVCEHTLGMPKATSGLFAYGGTAVSSGYAIIYRAANQGFAFAGGDYIASGKFLRGEKYKILWKVTRNEEGKFIFSLENDGKVLKEITQSYNQYWRNVYYVFGSTYYETRIGGTAYEVTISIEGKRTCHVVPALDPTGAPCMYDLVSGTTFYNSGTGDFIYPSESSTYALRRVLPDWGKLTPHGLRRLYHAPADYEGDIYEYALANGYKQIVEPEQPEEGYWAPVWHEREDCIELEWVETEPPQENI